MASGGAPRILAVNTDPVSISLRVKLSTPEERQTAAAKCRVMMRSIADVRRAISEFAAEDRKYFADKKKAAAKPPKAPAAKKRSAVKANVPPPKKQKKQKTQAKAPSNGWPSDMPPPPSADEVIDWAD